MPSEAALRELVTALRAGTAPAPPPPALVELAGRARRLGPRDLHAEAMALLAGPGAEPARIAAMALARLRGIARDIAEHGAHAEYADERSFVAEAIAAWEPHARGAPSLAEQVLLERGLEDALVAFIEHAGLPRAEAAAWAKVRAARTLARAIATLVAKGAPAPWFAELLAAHIGRELEAIARSPRAAAWMATLADAPALVALIGRLGSPPLFGARALAHARAVAQRHAHAPTADAIAALAGTTKPRTAKPRTAKPRTAKPRTAKPRAAKPRAAKPRAAKPRTKRTR